MRKWIIFLFFLLIFTTAINANPQKANPYFITAQNAYENGRYSKALSELIEVKKLLGKSNAIIAALETKIYYTQRNYLNAKSSLDNFFSFESEASLHREMSGYLLAVEKRMLSLSPYNLQMGMAVDGLDVSQHEFVEETRLENPKDRSLSWYKINNIERDEYIEEVSAFITPKTGLCMIKESTVSRSLDSIEIDGDIITLITLTEDIFTSLNSRLKNKYGDSALRINHDESIFKIRDDIRIAKKRKLTGAYISTVEWDFSGNDEIDILKIQLRSIFLERYISSEHITTSIKAEILYHFKNVGKCEEEVLSHRSQYDAIKDFVDRAKN